MLGCRQSQDLGILSANLDEVNNISQTRTVAEAQHSQLSKPTVLEEYQDYFDKLGCFPGEKYHIQLIDDPVPVIHPPRTVPVHILPLYKEELDKMITDDVITAVEEPTDWVTSCVTSKKPQRTKRRSGFALTLRTLTRIYVESTITPVPLTSSCHSYMERSSSPLSTPKKVIGM